MFSQVDDEGNMYVLFYEIIDHRTDGSEVKQMTHTLPPAMGVVADARL